MKHAAPTFVTVKKMNLALQPCRISLDHMSQMLLYSRPYHSWAPWTDVWFCHCFLAALPPRHVQPFMDDFAGGNDVPPGFPEDEEWMEDENGHQVP